MKELEALILVWIKKLISGLIRRRITTTAMQMFMLL